MVGWSSVTQFMWRWQVAFVALWGNKWLKGAGGLCQSGLELLQFINAVRVASTAMVRDTLSLVPLREKKKKKKTTDTTTTIVVHC